MRFSLVDLLIATFFAALAAIAVRWLSRQTASLIVPVAAGAAIAVAYLAVLPPIYRRFRLPPMILPRCPCCSQRQQGFYVSPSWPRVRYTCPTCKGDFVIWHNGRPGDDETWERPVLALRWPYAFGRYQQVSRPGAAPPRA